MQQKKPAYCSRCQVTSCWKRTRLASAPGSGEAAGTSAGLMSGLLAGLPAPHSPGSALFRPGASPRSQWESLCRVLKDLKTHFPSQKGKNCLKPELKNMLEHCNPAQASTGMGRRLRKSPSLQDHQGPGVVGMGGEHMLTPFTECRWILETLQNPTCPAGAVVCCLFGGF